MLHTFDMYNIYVVLDTFDNYNIYVVLDIFTIKYNMYNICKPRSAQADSRLCPIY
jgi:hypothetical protein